MVEAARLLSRNARPARKRGAGRLAAALALVTLVAVALLVAGCGGSKKADATPPPTASGGSGSGGGQSKSSEQLVKYAQCMRSHGLSDFPDPVNGQLSLRVTKGSDLDPNSSAFKSAAQACQSLAPAGLQRGSGQSTQQQTQFLKFAQCMRKHGVSNFPDPQAGGFLIQGSIQQNPNFGSAMQACRPLLPAGGVTAP
jgi:hypothetical protein